MKKSLQKFGKIGEKIGEKISGKIGGKISGKIGGKIGGKISGKNRVAKYQGYWGYIRVKMFAGWGKKFGRTCNFAKSSLFGKIYAFFSSFPCTN